MAISLRIKYSRKFNFNPKDIVKFILKIQYKLGAIVEDNWFKSAMALINVVDVYTGYIFL